MRKSQCFKFTNLQFANRLDAFRNASIEFKKWQIYVQLAHAQTDLDCRKFWQQNATTGGNLEPWFTNCKKSKCYKTFKI